MSSLYGDVHTTSGRPTNRPRRKAILVHKDGILFTRPTRGAHRLRPLNARDGFIQELLLTEGLPAVRALGQRWFEGFVDKGE